MELSISTLHHVIIETIVERGFAPSPAELAARFGATTQEVSITLRALADYHGVVLHPNTDAIWVVHPFATAPTPFLVTSGDRRWWGNCAWCSLGAAHLIGGQVRITTTLGAYAEQVVLHIEDGQLKDQDLVVHFPVPMTKSWDNVQYTCSVMLFFRDEAAVDAWQQAHGITKGDVRPINQIWNFAKDWYGRHRAPDWRKWTVEEAAALFKKHGLDGPIWELSAGGLRF